MSSLPVNSDKTVDPQSRFQCELKCFHQRKALPSKAVECHSLKVLKQLKCPSAPGTEEDKQMIAPRPTPTFLLVLRDPGQSEAWKSSADIHSRFWVGMPAVRGDAGSPPSSPACCARPPPRTAPAPGAAPRRPVQGPAAPPAAPPRAPPPPGARPPAPAWIPSLIPIRWSWSIVLQAERGTVLSLGEPAPGRGKTAKNPTQTQQPCQVHHWQACPPTAQNEHLTSGQLDLGPSRVFLLLDDRGMTLPS